MANQQLLLNNALITVIVTVLCNSQDLFPKDHFIFSDPTVPNPFPFHYNIELTLLDFENTSNNYFNIHGKCDITFQIISSIMSFKINVAPSMNILASNLVIKKDPIDVYTNDLIIENTTLNYTIKRYTNELSSYQEWIFTKELQKTTYIMTLEFNALQRDNEKGFFRTSNKFHIENSYIEYYRYSLIATNSQPNGAHQMFPCFEHAGHRATFNISVKVHNKYLVLANMGRGHADYFPGCLQMRHFAVTPKISVYQVAILIYNFNYISKIQFTPKDTISSRTSEIHMYQAEMVIANVTFFLQKEWPAIKDFWDPTINYVLIPGFPYDSADGWRLVFLREERVIYNQQIDTFGRKIAVTRFVTQKVTHQWLGSTISFYNWTDLWVNDGLVIFYGMEAINKTFPEFQMLNLFVVQDIYECLHMDTNSFLKPLYSNVNSSEIDTSLYFSRYLKASALMRMLYFMMPDYFHEGVVKFTTAKYERPPKIDDVWQKMQVSLEDVGMFYNKTVKEVMDTWIENNYPIVNVQTNFDVKQENVVVTVTQENSDKFNLHKWWILITWFTNDLLNHTDRITPSFSTWLCPNETMKTITILDSKNSWIIVNTKRNGYYRVSYDNENWRRIARFLEENFTKIHVLNRAQLIDDSFHFVLLKKLDVRTYWDITKFLSKDTDYIAWYPMFKTLEYMSPIFIFHDDRIWHLKLHLLSLLVPLLDRIGYDAKPNEDELTECLREEAAKWICVLDHSNCNKIAKKKLKWHLENRKENKLSPGWKKWTYCEGLKTANSLIWHNVAHAWDEEHDDTLLQSLICSKNHYIVTESFNTMKNKNIIKHLQPRDEAIYLVFFLAKYANHKIIDYILYDLLPVERPREVKEIAALSIIINNIYTTAGLAKIVTYVTNKPLDINSKILSKIRKRLDQLTKVKKYAEIVTKPEEEIK